MSEITQNFVVQPNNINITVDNNTINFTPSDIALNVYAGGVAQVNGTSGQLQYNNGGILGGVPNTDYNGTKLSLGSTSDITISGGSQYNVLTTDGAGVLSWAPAQAASSNALTANIANVHIYGGVNGYVLQTDGTGNLTWTAQIGGTPGNGSPGGANSQIQFNNAGNFGGVVGTSYDGANFTLGNIGNVKLTGGNVNQFVITTGNGNLAFANSTTGTGWTNVANIAVNDIFLGKLFGNANGVAPGATTTTFANIDFNNWTSASNVLPTFGLSSLIPGNNYMIGVSLGNSGTGEANIYQTQTGISWIRTGVPFIPSGVVQANNNIVIYDSGSNNSAYSTDQGNTWTYANNINTTLNLGDSAFGNGTIIISRSEFGSNNFIKSHDLGLTWSNSNFGTSTFPQTAIGYGNGKFISLPGGGTYPAKITTDNGNTWANITLPATYLWRSIAYGNNKWVATSEYGSATNRGAASVSTDDGITWTTTILANVSWDGVAYANGTFIISNSSDGNVRTSTDGITWSANISTSAPPGYGRGHVAFNDTLNLLTVAGYSNTSASTLTPKIVITSSDGNASNVQVATVGTYKNLGGIGGNVGAMWVRTA